MYIIQLYSLMYLKYSCKDTTGVKKGTAKKVELYLEVYA